MQSDVGGVRNDQNLNQRNSPEAKIKQRERGMSGGNVTVCSGMGAAERGVGKAGGC